VENYIDDKKRGRWWILTIVIVVILAAIVFGGFLVWNSLRTKDTNILTKGKIETEKPAELPRMANQPPKKEAPEPITPSYTPDAPLLE
jgi:flagellar basal body-associated protein FliL